MKVWALLDWFAPFRGWLTIGLGLVALMPYSQQVVILPSLHPAVTDSNQTFAAHRALMKARLGRRRLASILASLSLFVSVFVFSSQAWASCAAPGNAIERENCLPGTPQSTWDVSGAGDSSIQGFATDISVNVGQTISFKVDTTATTYHLDIYRLGYYQGNGARKIATLSSLPGKNQPACKTDSTGLIDCGNWTGSPSESWQVPSTAVSGVYFARAIRDDTQGASHIFFIVRNDSSSSDILFKTSDTTWQAYNDYGGANMYIGGPGPQGGAYKVSYNRPFHTRVYEFWSWVFNAEYPMIRFLEANGYDVSYFTSVDADRFAPLMLQHKTVLSVGHDEYWSGDERANVEAARAAGINLAFITGNGIFWKTRWEPSIDGSSTPYRTMVCYKETHANAVTDPQDPPTWTGTWRDPRFSPPADGGRPENALSGTIFYVNGPGPVEEIKVPQADGQMRFWRNTKPATLASGQTYTTSINALGYEWDTAPDNGSRPAGLFNLSTATYSTSNYLLDYGSSYGSGTATHHLTMYRYVNGSNSALIFGSGTSQWPWGLDGNHDGGSTTPDVNLQQATVNLLADMGVQPVSLQAGLQLASASTDKTPPASTITSPTNGASIPSGTNVTIQGTAADAGGGVVGGVEVSTDNGVTWHPATGRASWTYTWAASGNSTNTILSRAVDDSGNLETPSTGITVTVGSGSGTQTCPCTIFGNTTPTVADTGTDSPVELGVRFKSDVAGSITGIRFYKSAANTGTHVGNLWSSTGTLLASVTFSGESGSGWQTASFSTPVAVTAGTYYIASYHSTIGHYAEDNGFFANSGYDNAPLHAPQNGVVGANGVYAYGSTSIFPTQTFQSANYWVDVVFTPSSSASGISSVTLNPSSVSGGSSSNGTVTLTGPAPSGGLPITLSSDNAKATLSPTSLTIPGGSSSGSFTVNTTAVTAITTARITASDGKTSVQSTLTITPVAHLSAISVNPTSVVGGNNSTGTVTLDNPAPTGGALVTLASDNSAATVPASVTVQAGATTATFNITTSAVTSATTTNISATYNGITPTPATLTINPAALSAVSLNPATVVGGNSSTGTVTLTGLAPSGGITISLTSSNASVVTVPASVTVPAGASSITFQATTVTVTASTPVTITASYAGLNKTATLTVTATPPLAIDKTIWTDRSTSASTIASPTFTTSAANELLLAFVSADAPSSGTNTTVSSISGGGLTWVLVRRTNTQLGTAEVWRAFAPTALTNATVTATLSRSVAASMTVVTFTGADITGTNGSGAIGATASGNAASGAPTASLTTTRNGSWVFGVGIDWDNAIARTVPADQTMAHQYLATVGDTYWVQRQASPTPTSGTLVTINDTAPTSDRYNLTIVEVLPAQ